MNTSCLIIGSGPAGYTAAIYAGRAGISTILLEGDLPGGQLTQTTDIENFPGYPEGINGFEMMDDLRKQAARFGAQLLPQVLASIDLTARPFAARTQEGEMIAAQTVIIATGASARYLGLPDEKVYAGRGVSACATCDGFFYRKKRVAVVGGGDTACEEAVYLAGLAAQVYLIVRRDELRASQIMQSRVQACANIEVLWEHETLSLYGEEKLEGARLMYRKGRADAREVELPLDGFFLAIGHHPNSDLFRPLVQTNAEGYILTEGVRPLTNVAGVFAAGDVADPLYRQAITAAASGCRAALEVERYLQAQANG
jgi:thioredoxin reductase (NADPH)